MNGEVPHPRPVFIAPKMKIKIIKLRMMMWPEIILAKRRTIRANGLVKIPSSSTGIMIGFTPNGTGGLALEIVDGGIMENVSIDNLVIEGPQVPLFLRLGNRARPYISGAPVPPPGKIRNIHLSNIFATGADITGCSLTGIPGSNIENISLNNISITTTGCDTIPGWPRTIEEKIPDYPEGTMFGKLPAYGLFIRHASDIKLSNITLRTLNKETRPGIIVAQTDHFILAGLDLSSSANTPAALYISESNNGFIHHSNSTWPAKQFYIKDNRSSNIDVEK